MFIIRYFYIIHLFLRINDRNFILYFLTIPCYNDTE